MARKRRGSNLVSPRYPGRVIPVTPANSGRGSRRPSTGFVSGIKQVAKQLGPMLGKIVVDVATQTAANYAAVYLSNLT